MADKDQVFPLAPAGNRPRSDEESATSQSNELRRKKKIKIVAYIAAFAVFQTIIILVFALTVMRIKTPDVKLRSVVVENLNIINGTSPSFSMTLIGQLTVKNKNFGHYKFDSSIATVSYWGMTVGEALIDKGRTKARNTRRMNITMEVTSERLSDDSNLSSDINSGMLMLSSHAKISGKVQLMKIMKKRKTNEMNCTMTSEPTFHRRSKFQRTSSVAAHTPEIATVYRRGVVEDPINFQENSISDHPRHLRPNPVVVTVWSEERPAAPTSSPITFSLRLHVFISPEAGHLLQQNSTIEHLSRPDRI
ncbi:hypothetical protein HHK36_027631 [Tetracentron sinense]|uniref:Late embryogenesis abundant protein LEA-2 subgroup domain-containing protein n=1 Tax=Tetracentron sinense TaxID=13715 RepID=A0A834YEB6_TETSI|nr:hypothetical protein HHK36_027631 [Tetracentron sinense]